MYFTLYINPQTPSRDADEAIIQAAIDSAVQADEAGFRGVALTHHHFSDYNTYGNSFLFGAHLAGKLKQAWLLMQVAVAPLLNPVMLVEDSNLLDQLWGGRFIIGIGKGSSPLEFEGLGRSRAQANQLTEEVMAVADRLWRHRTEEGPFEYRTTHDHGVIRGRINPSAFRKPRPHIARGAVSEKSMEEAGLHGVPLFFGRLNVDGVANALRLYHGGLERSGVDSERIEFCKDWTTLQKTILIADTDGEAQEAIDEPLANMQRLVQVAFANMSDDERKAIMGIAKIDPSAYRKSFIEGSTIVGSPETMIRRLREYEAVGIRHVALHLNFGFMDQAIAQRTLDLLINKVMPAFR